MTPYSIFIPCAAKDFHKLKFLLRSIERNLTGWDDVWICAPNMGNAFGFVSLKEIVDLSAHRVDYVTDREVLDIDISIFRHRPNWIGQQFLKLFQNVTRHDLFLTIDADVIFNRPLPLFTPGDSLMAPKRIWWCGYEQFHPPYYTFNREMLGLNRDYQGTFLADMNFFDKRIIEGILYGRSKEEFIARAAELIGPTCYPSEADIFGQYFYRYHPNLYEIRRAKTATLHKHVQAIDEIAWTDEEIKAEIENHRHLDIDFFAIHSWWMQK